MTAPLSRLDPHAFWRAVSDTSRRAREAGALQPIRTTASYVEDRGVEFVVRVSDNLLRKQGAPTTYDKSRGANPFLPPDPLLTVGDLPPHHVAVLNKFNVIEDHLLVVTRRFVHQEARLTADDFAAVAPGLGGGSLAFYNASRAAGASQAHKHFQLVPLPLGRSAPIPTGELLDHAAEGLDTVEGLPFRHALARPGIEPADATAFGRACLDAYQAALSRLDIEPGRDGGETRLPPYNLLLTNRWMLVVPRRREHFREISVNGLGYAGSLFVSTTDKLEQVRATGPFSILASVSTPSS